MKLNRRQILKSLGVGFCAGFAPGWMQLALASDRQISSVKGVILLWLNGGPATIDLWDLKTGHVNGGEFRPIDTNVPGMQISEHLPALSNVANHFSIIRSMSTREGDHSRARVVASTGYTPQGAIKFPSLGSLVAHEYGQVECELPSYVHIGGRPTISGGGFLGPNFAPFVVGSSERRAGAMGDSALAVADLRSPESVSTANRDERLRLLEELGSLTPLDRSNAVVDTIESATERGLKLMNPNAAEAFDLEKEEAILRDAYGRTRFGQGCLMARRLIERGVPFVEVTLDGWDTHNDNFARVKELSQQFDAGFASLLTDLEQRGLLSQTLIVCQGEFGRTPTINGQAGRDHWPSSWSVVLGGGGIRGGQVVGETSGDGVEVVSRPVRTADLNATIFRAIGLDPMKQNMSNVGRPIRLADPEAQAVEELL